MMRHMAIKTYIKATAEKRGIMYANQLAQAMGVSPDVGARLWREDFTRIDFETLDRLCITLKCQPGTLIKHEPEA
jgi:DNA-binding Xre family transcriptional regulator